MEKAQKYNKYLYNTEKRNRGTSLKNGQVEMIRQEMPSTLNTLLHRTDRGGNNPRGQTSEVMKISDNVDDEGFFD